MDIKSKITSDGKETVLILPNRFVFATKNSFRSSYENIPKTTTKITLDLGAVEYIDSAAIGMMLILNDFAQKNRIETEIINCFDTVYHILTLAHIHDVIPMRQSGEERDAGAKRHAG